MKTEETIKLIKYVTGLRSSPSFSLRMPYYEEGNCADNSETHDHICFSLRIFACRNYHSPDDPYLDTKTKKLCG